MSTKSIPWYVWGVPAALLLLATARLPYGYYTFTRIVVCAAGALLAYTGWNEGRMQRAFAIALVLMAVLFNPLIPIHLGREVWLFLDLAAAAIFGAHLVLVRLSRN